jgi:hypothetical protein
VAVGPKSLLRHRLTTRVETLQLDQRLQEQKSD